MSTWFTSDTHFNHKNIVAGTSDWPEGNYCRDFKTLEEHNETLIRNFNEKVKEDDVLYHLGDWSFGGIDSIWKFWDRLNCLDIHLILGNHDHHIEKGRIAKLLGEDGSQIDVDLRKLFSSVQHYKEITIEGQMIVMSHYAMRVWNKSHKGSWMLYGHSHGTLAGTYYKSMDVGVDTNNLYPYSFEEIRTIMRDRETLLDADHHGERTNP